MTKNQFFSKLDGLKLPDADCYEIEYHTESRPKTICFYFSVGLYHICYSYLKTYKKADDIKAKYQRWLNEWREGLK